MANVKEQKKQEDISTVKSFFSSVVISKNIANRLKSIYRVNQKGSTIQDAIKECSRLGVYLSFLGDPELKRVHEEIFAPAVKSLLGDPDKEYSNREMKERFGIVKQNICGIL